MSHTERTAKTVATRKARLESSKARMEMRERSAQDAIAKAEAALKAAQERLAKAQAKLDTVRKDAATLIAKQTSELQTAQERHANAVTLEQRKAQRAAAKRTAAPAGEVETEAGDVRPLSKDAAEVIKRVLGRRCTGTLADSNNETQVL